MVGKFFTDYKNKQTGETVYVNDGINQVIEIDNKYWNIAQNLANNFSWVNIDQVFLNEFLISTGTLRTDLFFTINNVLQGQAFVPYNIDDGCFLCAKKQETNNGGSPSGPYGQMNLWIDNSLKNWGETLTSDYDGAVSKITSNLLSGNSVVTGVNYASNGINNRNSLTDHFINIVGQGNDVHGNYFIYWDNNTDGVSGGTNINNNILRVGNNQIIDNTTWAGLRFRVTEIRPNN